MAEVVLSIEIISATSFAGPDISEERRRRPADIDNSHYELLTMIYEL